MSLHSMNIVSESASTLDLQGVNGLSEDEAQRRLVTEGPNELPTEKPRGFLAIALEVAREPMFLMLVAAGSLYLLMGEPADALMLLGFVLVVMTITIVQERRTERALDALRDLSSPGRSSSAMVSIVASPVATSCEATSWSLPKVTAFPPMASCVAAAASLLMSPC